MGDVRIQRILEMRAPDGPASSTFLNYEHAEWERASSAILESDWNADRTGTILSHQSWVVESEGRTILVDTSIGNHKPRPDLPIFDDLETSYLADLRAVGIEPESVDLVVATHLHMDHVGWNTTLVDGEWVPTFPNARYFFPKADVVFFDPAHDGEFSPRRSDGFMRNVFDDSVAPILASGRAEVWEDRLVIDANITLESAPGHTPGNAVVKVASRGDHGVFIGDMMHSAVQFALPHLQNCYCEDPLKSGFSRIKTLTWAEDNRALIFPAHFGGDHAAEVGRDVDGRFALKAWRALPDG